jgi:alpha-mannosidase
MSISDPRVVLSALRRNPQDDIVLRVYNPTSDPVKGTVTFGFPVKHAVEANLLEEPKGRERKLVKGRLTLHLKPKKILTLLLKG